MRLLEPPGWPWLLTHEMRMAWRSAGSIRSSVLMWVLLGLLALMGHVAGWFFARVFDVDFMLARMPGMAYLGTTFILLLVLSFAFGLAVRSLLERGDYDLLFASPVPATTVFAVRGIAVALGAAAMPAFVWLPVANMGPFAGRWELLVAYPVLLAIGLGAAAVALASTLGLVRLLGLRRARVAAQVLGALAGAALLIAMQLPQVIAPAQRAAFQESMQQSSVVAMLLGPDSPLGWPLRALAGQPGPALLVVALGVGAFVLVVRATAGTFIAAVQQAPEAPASTRSGSAAPFRAFSTGLARVMVAKELRLIARDPALIGMTLLQMLYLVPLFLILVRSNDVGIVLAVSLVALATNLAGSLGWLAISGEEAPDLLGSAPVSPARVQVAKVAAALLPVGVVVLPFLAWYFARSPGVAIVVAAFVFAGCASSAAVQVALGKPGGKRDLKRRKQDIGANLLEGVGTFAWAGALWLALAGSGWALLPIAIGLLVPLGALAVRRRKR